MIVIMVSMLLINQNIKFIILASNKNNLEWRTSIVMVPMLNAVRCTLNFVIFILLLALHNMKSKIPIDWSIDELTS